MIRINAKAIGIKEPMKVNETFAKVKETFKFQKEVLQQSKPKGKTSMDRVVNYYDAQIKGMTEMLDYIQDMLDLKSAQIKNLRNANFHKVAQLSNQIVTKMLHYDQDDNKQSKGKK